MNYYLIAPAQSFHNTDSLLTYESEQKLEIGQVVTIPLGKKSTLGIVMQKCDKPSFETKPIQNILYEEPLPPKLTKALSWLADYYRAPMSSVIQAALPRGITKKRRDKTEKLPEVEKITDNTLNSAQKQAIAEIEANTSRTTLLHGITGSGKTNVYIELAKHTLEKNQSVILLVPEIALTSQLVRNFRAHFDNIFLLHSELSESLRHQIWERILKAKEPSIILLCEMDLSPGTVTSPDSPFILFIIILFLRFDLLCHTRKNSVYGLCLEFVACLVGNKSRAYGHDGLSWLKVVLKQRLSRFDDIDDNVRKSENGSKLDRAV